MLLWRSGLSSYLPEPSRKLSPCTWSDDVMAQSSIGLCSVCIVERCFPGNRLYSIEKSELEYGSGTILAVAMSYPSRFSTRISAAPASRPGQARLPGPTSSFQESCRRRLRVRSWRVGSFVVTGCIVFMLVDRYFRCFLSSSAAWCSAARTAGIWLRAFSKP
jgi:hypothetical protein